MSSISNKKPALVFKSKDSAQVLLNKRRVKKARSRYTSILRASSGFFSPVICDRLIKFFDHRGPDEGQVEKAKVLTEDLLLVVRQEHAKMQCFLNQQQMELHQAQAQYAAYSAMAAVGTFSMWVRQTGCFLYFLHFHGTVY